MTRRADDTLNRLATAARSGRIEWKNRRQGTFDGVVVKIYPGERFWQSISFFTPAAPEASIWTKDESGGWDVCVWKIKGGAHSETGSLLLEIAAIADRAITTRECETLEHAFN